MTDTHPAFPEGQEDEIRHDAVEIFKAVDGYGLARVDFFLQPDGTVVFNEINTLPGFTSISMYPMLWDAKGLKVNALIDKLIELALKRFQEERMKKDAPIGVFDSGVGGLTVAREIIRQIPNARIV